MTPRALSVLKSGAASAWSTIDGSPDKAEAELDRLPLQRARKDGSEECRKYLREGKKAGTAGRYTRWVGRCQNTRQEARKANAKEVSEPAKPKKPFGGPQEGSGRPRIVVDLGLVEKLAQIHASQEIAATLGFRSGSSRSA